MLLPRRRPNVRVSRVGAGIALGLALAGCSDETVPVVGIAHPTLVQVSPDEFLGDVPCVDSPGAMRRYVATVFDLPPVDADAGAEAPDFALPSSTVERGDGRATPMPCTQSVSFSHLVQDHRYWAAIDGYDRDDLVALAPGTRLLYDPLSSERVEPRWTTSCAEDAPILGDSAPAGATLVEVSLDGALGMLECGTEAGSVDHFVVTPPNGAPMDAACGESVALPGLGPVGATLTLSLKAFEAGASEPSWGTSCVAEIVSGVTTRATCYPLSSAGVLEVDPLDALTALGLECDALSFEELGVEMTDAPPDPRFIDASECARPLRFQGRPAGAATARAEARFADGTRSGAVLCSATVVPGDTARAACAREP
jgi:hypothetical protein